MNGANIMSLILYAKPVEFDNLPAQLKYYYDVTMNQREEIKSIWFYPNVGMAKRNYYRITAESWIHQWTYDPRTDSYDAKRVY
jgi:hypothetical protein